MKQKIKHGLLIALCVVLILSLNLLSVASALVDSSSISQLEDGEVLSSASDRPIYYTEGYTPGMYRNAADDDVASYAAVRSGSYAAVRYGSYSYAADNVWLMLTASSSGLTTMKNPFSQSAPTVTASSKQVQASHSYVIGNTVSNVSLIVSASDSSYFDFSSSDLAFTQSTSDANKFLLNGTFSFTFKTYCNLYNSTSGSSRTFYMALYPVAVQPLIDGKPYGDPVSISTYTNGFTGLITGSPSVATVSFSDYSFYYTGADPELFGFRVYVDCDYNDTVSLSSATGNYTMFLTNTLSWTKQPTITYSVADSGLYGLLYDIFENTYIGSGVEFLSRSGNFVTDTGRTGLDNLVRLGFMGLRTLLVAPSGYSYLGASGESKSASSNGAFPALYLTQGFLGLATLLRQINTSLSGLDGASSGVDKLVNVFARDDDIQLRDDVDPVISSAADSFFSSDSSTAVTESRVSDAQTSLEGASAMFDSGYSVDSGFAEIAESKDDFLSWFTSDTLSWLDTTVSSYDSGEDDPYNYWLYNQQMAEVAKRRGE